MCGSLSGGRPGPSSLTSTMTRSPTWAALIMPTVSPGVCTSTFMSRLSMARRRSSSSPTAARSSAIRTCQVRAGWATRTRSAHPVTTAVRSTGSRDWPGSGIVQRPGRAVLTMLGTILGVGAFVAVLGLTATGAGQISRQFTVLEDTTLTVEDNGPANNVAAPSTNPPIGFPAGADAVADHISGVVAAGVWWPVTLPPGANFTGSLALSATASQNISLLAASPGAVQAMGLKLAAGS